MRKTLISGLIVACGLTLLSQGADAAASQKTTAPATASKSTAKAQPAPVDPMTITQKLSVKDDQGKNWILKNAKEYQMNWAYEDPSPYQQFDGFLGPDGKLLFVTSFDYAMAMDLNGKVIWKQPLSLDLNRSKIIGEDDTAYFLNEGDGLNDNSDDTTMELTGIERVDTKGQYTHLPSVDVYAPKDEYGFSDGYPLTDGDANGNLLLLTKDGLTSYKPDGTVGWQHTTLTYQDQSFDTFDIRNLFSDGEGYSYLQFDNALLQIDQSGVVHWRTAISPGKDYFIAHGYLIAWSYNAVTKQPAYQVYTYAADGKLSAVTDRKAVYRLINGQIDQLGGVYDLDEKTNTLTDKDWLTGKLKWSFALSKSEINWGHNIAAFTMRADPIGHVYFSANVGTVYALDRRGKPRFTVSMSNGTISYSDIIPISDKLTIILNNNHIVCIGKKS